MYLQTDTCGKARNWTITWCSEIVSSRGCCDAFDGPCSVNPKTLDSKFSHTPLISLVTLLHCGRRGCCVVEVGTWWGSQNFPALLLCCCIPPTPSQEIQNRSQPPPKLPSMLLKRHIFRTSPPPLLPFFPKYFFATSKEYLFSTIFFYRLEKDNAVFWRTYP